MINDLIKHKYFKDPVFPLTDNCLKTAVSIRVTVGLAAAGFFFTCPLNCDYTNNTQLIQAYREDIKVFVSAMISYVKSTSKLVLYSITDNYSVLNISVDYI